MNLNDVKADGNCTLYTSTPRGLEMLNVLKRHFLGCGKLVTECNAARRINVIRPSIFLFQRVSKPLCFIGFSLSLGQRTSS